jgi:hypothetical protein
MQDAVAAEPETLMATCAVSRWNFVMNGLWRGAYAVFVTSGLVHFLIEQRAAMAVIAAVCVASAVDWIYEYGWRTPMRLELTRTTLRKKSLFRTVEFPILSVRDVYLGVRRNKARKMLIDGARPGRTVKLRLEELEAIDPFLATLTSAAPGIKVHVSALSVQRRL